MHLNGLGKNLSRVHVVEVTDVRLGGGDSIHHGSFRMGPLCVDLERLLTVVRDRIFSALMVWQGVKTVSLPVLGGIDCNPE